MTGPGESIARPARPVEPGDPGEAAGADEPFDLRTLPLALAAWAGARAGTGGWRDALVVGLLAAAALPVLARRRGAAAIAALLVLLAGFGVGHLRAAQLDGCATARLAGERATATVLLRTTSDPTLTPRRGVIPEHAQADVTVLAVQARGTLVREQVPAQLRGSAARSRMVLALPAGSTLRAEVRAAPPLPGQGRAAVLTLVGPPEVVAPPGAGARVVDDLRAGLHRATWRAPARAAGLLPSLVVGDTSGLDSGLQDDFRATGLTHLTAVSGTNLTLSLAFLLGVARWVGVRGWWLRSVGLVAVACFVVVCRAEPSVLRAAAMGLVAMAGLGLAGGRGRGVRHLCVAVWLLSLADPWLSRSPGFLLSTLATLGILAWARRWSKALGWAPGWLAENLAVPLAAQLATQPVVTGLSGTISVVGLPANALAAPFVGPATVLGLATMLLAPLSSWLASWVGWAAAWCVQPVIWVAGTGAHLPAATWRWPANPAALVLLAGLCLVLSVLVPQVLSRRWACLLLALGVAVACWQQPRALGWPGDWQVAFCDVGQGDATAVRAAPHRAVVIDVGPAGGAALRCLRQLGVSSIPLMLLTHYHDDHIGALEEVLDAVPVGVLVLNPVHSPAAGSQRVARLAAAHGVRTVEAALGQHLRVGAVDLRVVGLDQEVPLVSTGTGESSGENDTSIVSVVDVAGERVVVGGDVEPDGQQEVVARGWDPHATVLKMPHHGSARQGEHFWCDTHAALAVASAGYRNDYGHPAPAALRLAQRCGMAVARTDLQGSIATWVADGRLQVRSQRDGPP